MGTDDVCEEDKGGDGSCFDKKVRIRVMVRDRGQG
jgi:hypothetical protein